MASITSYTTKDGSKYYKFQLYVGKDPLTGKSIKTTRRKFKTKKEAQLALSRLQLEIDKGSFNKDVLETYQDVYEIWIEQYKNTVKESTFVKTKELFKLHILPTMGKYKLDKINVRICQKHVNEWFKGFVKYRTIKAYASKVLDHAAMLEMISSNPMKNVTMPKKIDTPLEEKKIKSYTKEELTQFLQGLKEGKNFKAYVFFRLLAFSGIRQGEALALLWTDVNFNLKEISINKAKSKGEGYRTIIQTPKTSSSIRTIKLDDKTIQILKEWKLRQKQDLLALGYNSLHADQLIFSNPENTHLSASSIREWILRVQKNYNLTPITIHGLRHTHCSLLFEAGATVKEVQERLGHKDVQTTLNIYAHVSEKAKDVAAEKFSNYMNF